MITPTQAATAFAAPDNPDGGEQLVRDIALIMQHLGTAHPSDKDTARAQFVAGERGCLTIFSVLEMAKDATDTERMERRWQTARLGVFLEQEGRKAKLFDAICTDREPLKDAHPAAGLANIPFIPGRYEAAPWSRALHMLAAGLRETHALTPATARAMSRKIESSPG